jgi:poly(3-hydroxyalkanoate) synthetase
MSESKAVSASACELATGPSELALETPAKLISASIEQARMMQTYWVGLCRYILDFMGPSFSAIDAFSALEKEKVQEHAPCDNLQDYSALLEFNLRLAEKGLAHGMKAVNDFHAHQLQQISQAWLNTLCHREGEDIAAVMAKQARLMELVVHEYPRAIRNIEPEYGFHFDDGHYVKAAETDRFYLYQVLPRDKSVEVRKKGKPIVIIPPYVLGANILSFLPGEGKSFVHCFANQGIPTYIRIVKDIYANPAVQVMTGEEDCLDTKFFLEQVKAAHHRPVTLCGYCQGGFTSVINYLSGELDGLMDALITSVAPMDGTRSKGLVAFLDQIPERFEDISFAFKTLPNGHRVVNGALMSWVFKLKSLEKDNPFVAFYRDLKLFEKTLKINKTAAAINYWLLYDQTDLPLEVCKLSYDSYTIPITKDGTLPVKLFGRSLNLRRAREQGLKWLICVADKDDLVEKESALAPLDWVEAEVTVFPKGHVAIATSWSLPTTECSLDRCFLDYRGPVRYQLDLEAEQDKALMAATLIREEKAVAALPSTPGPASAAAPAPKRQEKAAPAQPSTPKPPPAKGPAPKRQEKAAKASPAAPKKRKG